MSKTKKRSMQNDKSGLCEKPSEKCGYKSKATVDGVEGNDFDWRELELKYELAPGLISSRNSIDDWD